MQYQMSGEIGQKKPEREDDEWKSEFRRGVVISRLCQRPGMWETPQSQYG